MTATRTTRHLAQPAPIPVHPFAERIVTLADWLGLEPAAFTYDPEDVAGGPLLTDALLDWLRSAGRPGADWALSGTPEGYTQEAALADPQAWRENEEFLAIFRRLDKTEQGLLLAALEKGASGGEALTAALEECQQAVDAHRAAKAA